MHPWEKAGNGSGNWVPATHRGDPDEVLASSWPSPSCCGHLGSDLVDGKLSPSLFRPFNYIKMNNLFFSLNQQKYKFMSQKCLSQHPELHGFHLRTSDCTHPSPTPTELLTCSHLWLSLKPLGQSVHGSPCDAVRPCS